MRVARVLLLALSAAAVGAGAYIALGRGTPANADHTGCAFETVKTYEVYLDEADQALTRGALNQIKTSNPRLKLPMLERSPDGAQTAAPYVPPVIAKAISHIESTWAMADENTARGTRGPVLTSVSCAYGMMQVLSGMQPVGERRQPTPTQRAILKQHRVNVLAGLRLLMQKWNFAGSNAREWPYVGDRNPKAVENWYYALWAYYSFSPSQSPANPDYPWPRPTYNSRECLSSPAHCTYADYPYQELVLGVVRNPAIRGIHPDGTPAYLWTAVPVQLPSRGLFLRARRPHKPRRLLWPPPDLPVVENPSVDRTRSGVPMLSLDPGVLTVHVTTRDPATLFQTATIIQQSGAGVLSPHIEVQTDGPTDDWLDWSVTSVIAPAKLLVSYNPAHMAPGAYSARFSIMSKVALGSPQEFTLTVCVADAASGRPVDGCG